MYFKQNKKIKLIILFFKLKIKNLYLKLLDEDVSGVAEKGTKRLHYDNTVINKLKKIKKNNFINFSQVNFINL